MRPCERLWEGIVGDQPTEGKPCGEESTHTVLLADGTRAPVCDDCAEESKAEGSEVLPFGVEHVDALQQPFCACGRIKPECDGSRKGCKGGST